MTPLHQFGELIRGLFLQVPLGVARGLFILLLAGLLVWVLTLPKAQTTPAKERPTLGENLKIWAAISLVVQIFIYSFF